MLLAENAESLSSQVGNWKKAGLRVAFVPTMGNLHEGHLSLVKKAGELADKIVVSIYVNPTQFGENEDFDSYPRTFDKDREVLQQADVDLLFFPGNDDMYPQGADNSTAVSVPALSEMLCGEYRPKHFQGVATVVCKLLNMVQPDIAVFGEKDFQQVAVIRKMVSDLFMPVEIETSATVREADGLAMSSRNQYLKQQEREVAVNLYQTLLSAEQKVKAGEVLQEVEQESIEKLKSLGFEPEYFSFRHRLTLFPANNNDKQLVLVAAAWLGKTRLIDNITLQILH